MKPHLVRFPRTVTNAMTRAAKSKVQSADGCALECGVGFRQLRTCRAAMCLPGPDVRAPSASTEKYCSLVAALPAEVLLFFMAGALMCQRQACSPFWSAAIT